MLFHLIANVLTIITYLSPIAAITLISSGLKSDTFVGACDLGSSVGHESMLEALNALTEATNNEDNVRNSMLIVFRFLIVNTL